VLQTLGIAGAAGLVGVTTATPGRDPGPKERELLVGLDTDGDGSAAQAAIDRSLPADATVTHRNETLGYVAVEVPTSADENVATAMASVESHSDIDYVERNATYETQVAPNDPQYPDQYAPQQVNAPTAWEKTLGSSDVTIGVVDTGAQFDHPDLASRYASEPGRDVVDDDANPYPSGGTRHGTHVSGCASAETGNETGIAGVSDSTLVNARVLGPNGSGSLSDIADGIQWAVDAGVDIINMSLGGPWPSKTLKRAVEYAYDEHDVLVICAAGNASKANVGYPAGFEECVSVAALTPDEELADFSNYGDDIDVAAPGVNVQSTVPTDEYAALSGTSMASPVVAGVAALGLAADPDLSASELRARLESTAVDVGLPETEQGAGRVDAARIVDPDGTGGSKTGYAISNHEFGLAMDVEDQSTENGADLVLRPRTERASQRWELDEVSEKTYGIVNVNSRKHVDVPFNSVFDGTPVHQWEWNGGKNQRWSIHDVAGGLVVIENVESGKFLTATPDGRVVQREWSNTDAQMWSLTDLS
jgi:serine protease